MVGGLPFARRGWKPGAHRAPHAAMVVSTDDRAVEDEFVSFEEMMFLVEGHSCIDWRYRMALG